MWAALGRVRARHPEVRWLAPESLHLTLLFLGAREPARLTELNTALAEVAAAGHPFDVRLGAAGGRAGGRRGGVAWLRLTDGEADVTRLARQLDERLPGLRRGQLNKPHLTVARAVDEALLIDLQASEAALATGWTVDRIALWRSHTGPRGARYEQVTSERLDASLPPT